MRAYANRRFLDATCLDNVCEISVEELRSAGRVFCLLYVSLPLSVGLSFLTHLRWIAKGCGHWATC